MSSPITPVRSPALPKPGVLINDDEGTPPAGNSCSFCNHPCTTNCSMCRKRICDDHTKSENNVVVCSNAENTCYDSLKALRRRR